MTAPICGARTWVLGEEVTCTRNHGHGQHGGGCARLMGAHAWDYTAAELRALADGLMRRADALDPAAAIAEAERRMVEAWSRYERLCRVRGEFDRKPALNDIVSRAWADWHELTDTWLALVEARDAKGGGA